MNVEYPKDLHRKHNELPILEERIKPGKVEKLVPNLENKNAYVVHIKFLNHALQHGFKLKKVHWVIRFEQRYLIKAFTMLNTKKRTAAKIVKLL